MEPHISPPINLLLPVLKKNKMEPCICPTFYIFVELKSTWYLNSTTSCTPLELWEKIIWNIFKCTHMNIWRSRTCHVLFSIQYMNCRHSKPFLAMLTKVTNATIWINRGWEVAMFYFVPNTWIAKTQNQYLAL